MLNQQNKKAIVKQHFKMAIFDTLRFDYFSDEYDQFEHKLDKKLEHKVNRMPEQEIDTMANLAIAGAEFHYDVERDEFSADAHHSPMTYSAIEYWF